MYFINRYIVYAIVAVLLLCSSNIKWGGNNWRHTILSDGKGYYVYLPAVFIYQDLNFSFINEIEEKYYDKDTRVDIRSYLNDKAYSKYSMGVAILIMPFFLLAHLFSWLFGLPIDGYSRLYTITVCLAAIFYLVLGLNYLKKLLGLYKISDGIKTLIVLAVVFGTSLYYYTVIEPAMSHVYSFAAVTMFIYYAKVYFKTGMYKYFLYLSLLLGIIISIKVLNVLIILALPFLSEDINVLKKTTRNVLSNIKTLVTMIFFPLFFIGLQSLFYYYQTGEFFFDSYREEAFDFTKPHFIDILFSYKKGLFVYTPLLLVSVIGTIVLLKSRKFEFWSFIIFFVILTYILSSWWSWYYGGSFGLRAYIEYYSLFMIVLALLLDGLKKSFYKGTAITIVILLILFCQAQTYQYRYYQIHWSEMTKEKYWDVFLRIDKLIKL